MKYGVPAFNVLLALLYLATSAVQAFVLKMALNTPGVRSVPAGVVPITYPMIAKAWLKRYTLLCSFLERDKKYLLKEYLILSTYAVACFRSNHVIVWPVTFALFMVPLPFLLYQWAFRVVKEKAATQRAVRNVLDREREISVENVNVGVQIICRPQQQTAHKHSDKTILQLVALPALCFIGMLLFFLCHIRLVNSVSNSGQLNLKSLLVIFSLDQLVIRPGFGLILVGALKLLEYHQRIDIQANVLVSELCQEEVVAGQASTMHKEGHRSGHEISSSPLKRFQQGNVKPVEQMFIDLDHLQPQIQLEQEVNQYPGQEAEEQHYRQEGGRQDKEQKEKEEKLEECAYLTTPEKEMFELQLQESVSDSHQTIIKTCLDEEKENYDNSINCSEAFEEVKDFQEFILARTPLEVNHGNLIEKGGSMDCGRQVGGQKGRRKNKRVLKMGGPSPYLQYLPNMLKKVEKFKHIMKESRVPQPKML